MMAKRNKIRIEVIGADHDALTTEQCPDNREVTLHLARLIGKQMAREQLVRERAIERRTARASQSA